MDKNIKQAFKSLGELKPSSELEKAIFQRIELEQTRQIRRKLAAIYFGLFGSFVALAYSGVVYGGALLKSEFLKLVSLAFSDFLVVAEHWQEFSSSLLETLPTLNVIALLAPAALLLWSLGLLLDIYNKNHSKPAMKT